MAEQINENSERGAEAMLYNLIHDEALLSENLSGFGYEHEIEESQTLDND